MIDPKQILLTGGDGRLGTELGKILTGMITPLYPQFDLTKPEIIEKTLDTYQPKLVVHAAAYTDVSGAEKNKNACWQVNVVGTRNLVKALNQRNLPLIHISTDYVFDGTKGMYREDDPPGPVCNYYSLSKLVAEEIARMTPRHLVIRTSFRPREWPYPVAFTDIYTSQDYVDIIAPEIALAIRSYQDILHSTIHIATERKSVYDLARRRKADVKPGSKKDANVKLPDDISLDITRWTEWKKGNH